MRPVDVIGSDGGWCRSGRSLRSVAPVGVRTSEIGGRIPSTKEEERKDIGSCLVDSDGRRREVTVVCGKFRGPEVQGPRSDAVV